MRLMYIRTACIGLTLVLLSGCGMEKQASSHMDYKEVKTMVVDILKTEEGKKAIEEAQSSGGGSTGGIKAQSLNTQQQEQLKTAVKDTLTSSEYKEVIQKVMTDPKFAGDFAKAVSEDSKELHKTLIKDPEYQKSVSDIMKSPEVMKSYLEVMKSPEYRKQFMAIMKESMSSPLFKVQVMELLSKVVEEELQPKEKKENKQSDEGTSAQEEGGSSKGESGGSDKQGSS